MKITDVRTVLLTGPCTNDPFLSECRQIRSAAFIEIHTDTEHIGLGETYAGYRCPELIPQSVEYFKSILLDQNVDNITELWNRMYHCENFWCRNGLGITILNGIEAALWDLKGKLLGLPVYELLGGRKYDALDAYATGGPSNYPKENLARKIDHYQACGFRGIKLGVGAWSEDALWEMDHGSNSAADFEADKMQFVRSHTDKNFKIMLDGHMSNRPEGADVWNVDTAAAVCRAVEPFDVFFFEEPLHYNDIAGYTELCRRTTIPIAGGECLAGESEWRTYVDCDGFDIGQPDASWTGGLELCVKVAHMLNARGRKVAMHAWGAGGSLMQNIHVGFASPNTTILEIPPDYGPLHSEVIGDSLTMKDGKVLPPTAPGLGITLSDAVKNRFPFQPGSGEFNSVPGRVLDDSRFLTHA